METIKSTEKHTIFKKKNGRFAVRGSKRKWVNGDEKRDILLANGLIKITKASPKAAPVEEAAAEESAQ